MLKRALMMGLAVGVGLATLQSGTADAGWSFVRPPGMWWYTGSVHGCADISKVPNPLRHPAALQCEVTVTDLDVGCVNPQNYNVLPGEAANKYIVLSEPIDPASLTKKEKGVARDVCVAVEDNYFGVQCELRNWSPVVVVYEFRAECATRQCLGEDVEGTEANEACETLGEVEDTQVCQCTLPGGPYSLEAPPDAGIPYDCYAVEDGQLTNTKCELQ